MGLATLALADECNGRAFDDERREMYRRHLDCEYYGDCEGYDSFSNFPRSSHHFDGNYLKNDDCRRCCRFGKDPERCFDFECCDQKEPRRRACNERTLFDCCGCQRRCPTADNCEWRYRCDEDRKRCTDSECCSQKQGRCHQYADYDGFDGCHCQRRCSSPRCESENSTKQQDQSQKTDEKKKESHDPKKNREKTKEKSPIAPKEHKSSPTK